MDILVIICLDFSQYICLKPGRDWGLRMMLQNNVLTTHRPIVYLWDSHPDNIYCEFIKFEMLIYFGQRLFLPRIPPILSHSSHKQAHQFSQTTSNRKCSKHGQSGNDKNMFSQNWITFILFHSYLSLSHSFFFTQPMVTRTSLMRECSVIW